MSDIPKKLKVTNDLIFELSPFPMWVYDIETYQFLAVNREAMLQYGYSRDEFLKMTIKEIRPPQEIPKLEKAVKALLSRGSTYNETLYKHQKKDGTILHVRIKSNLINFQGKRCEIVTAIDLTDRYLQEKHIRKQKHYLYIIGEINQLLLRSDDWVEALNICFDLVGKTLDVDRIYFFENNFKSHFTSLKLEWNKNFAELEDDGPKWQQLPFSQFPDLFAPLQEGEPFEAVISSISTSPLAENLEKLNIRSILVLPVMINKVFSGFISLNDCRKERIWNENELELLKNLTSTLGYVIKESQAYQKLIDSEAKFRSLVQNGSDLIAIIDRDGMYKYVATNSFQILGIPPEKFIARNAFDFIHDDDKPRLLEQLKEILTKDRIFIEPYRFADAEGNWRWIQTELANHLADPNIAGIVANTKEVTAEVEKRIGTELVVSLTKTINRPGSLSNCLDLAMNNLVTLSKINICEIWLISEDKTRLNLISKAYRNKEFQQFYGNSKNMDNIQIRQGMPGYIWENQKSCLWKNLTDHTPFLRSAAAKSANLKSAIGIPIIYNEEFLGCIICLSTYKYNDITDHFKLLNEVGSQIGPVIKQKITEEAYQNFFDTSPNPNCIVGFDGYLKKVNQAFTNLLGFSKTELLSRPMLNLIYKEDRSLFKKNFGTQLQSINSYTTRLLTKNGKIKWLHWSGVFQMEAKVIVVVAKDITEQKIAEQGLKKAYLRLKTAQKIAKLGYWSRKLDSDISHWSEETYLIYGYTPSNFIPSIENITNTFHPADRHLMDSNPGIGLETDKIHSYEHRILTGSKEIKWINQEIRLLTDKAGKPFRIEGTVQDITERKEQQQQLAYSNERFRLAMEASNEIIWDIDHRTKTITRAKGNEKTNNYAGSEPFSKVNSWFLKIHPEDIRDVWDSLQKALLDKDTKSWIKEYRLYSHEGNIAYFVDRCHILRDEEGQPVRTIGSALDVTTSRQQLERIKTQNKNLREIAWLQSHVTRAPLARIMSLISLTELNGSPESKDEIFNLISESAKELDEVIHEVTHKINAYEDEDSGNPIN